LMTKHFFFLQQEFVSYCMEKIRAAGNKILNSYIKKKTF